MNDYVEYMASLGIECTNLSTCIKLNKECECNKLERHPQFAIYIVRVRLLLKL